MGKKIALIDLRVLTDQFKDWDLKPWTQGHGVPKDANMVAYDITLLNGTPYLRLVLESEEWTNEKGALLEQVVLEVSCRTEGFEEVRDESSTNQ